MFKIVFFWIGRIMLAGAYGWKKSSESFPAIIGATMYFVFWILCLIFTDTDFESEDKLFSIIASIALPSFYGLFVLVVRLKNNKSKVHSPRNARILKTNSDCSTTKTPTNITEVKSSTIRQKEIIPSEPQPTKIIEQKNIDKKINKNTMLIVFAIIIAILLIFYCVVFYHLYSNINDLNTQIDNLIKDKSELMNIIDELESTVSSQSDEIAHWKNEWKEIWLEHLLCE